MSRLRALGRWAIAGLVLLLGRGRREEEAERGRILSAQPTARGAETLVLLLLGAATVCAAGFIAAYVATDDTQLLGLALGLAFVFLAFAAALAEKRLLPQGKTIESHEHPGDEEKQDDVAQIVEESADTLSRRRLLLTAAGGAGVVLAAALVVPAASLGPIGINGRLGRSPWERGRRLVDERGRPLRADDVTLGSFVTAFPAGADRRELGSPLIVVRLSPEELELPEERLKWAPEGILAFSKICTHAACAISIYRHPLFEPTSAAPALVCPCHFSTFDVRSGGKRVFGPAARDLPQLPLEVMTDGTLIAGGGFSDDVGPSWSGIDTG